jgi:prolyl 4-hydroxylase
MVLYITAFIHNITQHRSVLRFPSDEDLNGAAVALMRLQDMYQLDTHALAEGELMGKKYSRQLSGTKQVKFKQLSE